MYYFDPSFGYIYIHTDRGSVRYGCGGVVPHDPQTVTEQRYTRFEGWVPIEPHYVPDEWLIAFKNPHEDQKITITEINFGWREWSILAPVGCVLYYFLYVFLTNFPPNR